MQISRRRFLAIAGAGLAVAGSVAIYPAIQKYWQTSHVKGSPDKSPFDGNTLETVAFFVAALYGRTLNASDREELVSQLKFAVQEDSGWRSEYSWLARHVDEAARQLGAADLKSVNDRQKEQVVLSIMTKPWGGKKSKLYAVFSEKERMRQRMHRSTFRQLQKIYLSSGVPWRHRGYSSWPGVAGDPREYTRPGPLSQC